MKRSIIKKIGNVLEEVAVLAAISVLVLFLASKLLPNFNYGLYIIQSGSMEPKIKTGSVVIDKKLDDYSENDIITYRQGKKIITHRIVGEIERSNGKVYETKGDANKTKDVFSVKKENVLGKVIFSVPYVGYFMSFARTKPGIILFIILPAVYLIWLEIDKMRKELVFKKKKEEISNNSEKNEKES